MTFIVKTITIEKESILSDYCLLFPGSAYPLPKSFCFQEYIEVERELWALFPETHGSRVNFSQIGLSAGIFVESKGAGDLRPGEAFFLMPCPDRTLRPMRMRMLRHLTLEEFRMSHLTGLRMAEKMQGIDRLVEAIHLKILGPEIFNAC